MLGLWYSSFLGVLPICLDIGRTLAGHKRATTGRQAVFGVQQRGSASNASAFYHVMHLMGLRPGDEKKYGLGREIAC